MSILQPPKPAKLVIGIFTAEVNIVETLVPELISHFGRVDLVSPWMAFNYTHYYEPEMGSPLHRRVYSFKSLIGQQDLADVKIATHQIEHANIDPGYLVRERFVLASSKNFSHRICIGAGIYADLTLIYQKGRFRQLPWTYPDYADDTMLNFLEQVRKKYLWDGRVNA
jgi:hypothetical protein